MAIVSNKRTVMTLHSGATDIHSHRVRIVLAEKGVSYEVIAVDGKGKLETLLEVNPYGTIPTLVDRELVLDRPGIITEYLDERFPHPPLMPVYPVARAKARMIIYRFEKEWFPLIEAIESGEPARAQAAKKELTGYLQQLVPHFQSASYFLGDEFTLVDCCIAPVFWRLPAWGIKLSNADMKTLDKYTAHVFERDSFQASLTESEQELRHAGIATTT